MQQIADFATEKVCLSRQETAHVLGVGVQMVDKLIRSGQLRAVKIGKRKWIIPTTGVYHYLFPNEGKAVCHD